jgi:hypothetical protein
MFKFTYLLENHEELDIFNNFVTKTGDKINFYQYHMFHKLLFIFLGAKNEDNKYYSITDTNLPLKYIIKDKEYPIKIEDITNFLDKVYTTKDIAFLNELLANIERPIKIEIPGRKSFLGEIKDTYGDGDYKNALEIIQYYYTLENLNILQIDDNNLVVNLYNDLLEYEIDNYNNDIPIQYNHYSEIESDSFIDKYEKNDTTSEINEEWITKILEKYGLPNLKNFIKKSEKPEKPDDAKRKYLKYKIKYLELKKIYKQKEITW